MTISSAPIHLAGHKVYLMFTASEQIDGDLVMEVINIIIPLT